LLLAGLLHNIGDFFFLSQFPAEFERVFQLGQFMERREAESTVFGITAARAGKLLLENWRFPPLFGTVAEHCDFPLHADCPAEFHQALALVYAGKKLAEAAAAKENAQQALQRIAPHVCQTFGLEPDLLTEVYQSLPERMSLEQLQAGRS